MLRLTDIKLPLDHPESALTKAILARLGITADELTSYTIARRSYDARRRGAIVLIYSVDVETSRETDILRRSRMDDIALAHEADKGSSTRPASNKPASEKSAFNKAVPTPDTSYTFVARAPRDLSMRPIVIGTGPCGLFAGLILAQMGFRPIVLERGKQVRERTVDTFGLWRKRVLNPESNVQFGEGGAGTFSDGKLYSQIRDPMHHGHKVLTEFVQAGAPDEILYVNKPHIGTFRLVTMVESMRATIESLGGEIRFSNRVEDIRIEQGQVRGVTLAGGEELRADHVVLALGHSARDTFAMLHARGVYLEAKPFSIGFRIEHPQSLIDRARFGPQAGHPLLGAADYKLVHHCSGPHAGSSRSVYSFCMCPGGAVVAAASEPGRVVTNGMSQYSRNERNANAAIVVGITPEDYAAHGDGPLAGIALQRHWEEHAFALGGGNYDAPAQLVGDFLAQRASTAFGTTLPSYTPGVRLCDLSASLPDYAIAAIREALPAFDRQIKGFAMADALLTGVETRTSSPLRIKRGADCQSVNTRGLYPAGEGAGYAGGILSAAVDGIKVAEALALEMVGATRRL